MKPVITLHKGKSECKREVITFYFARGQQPIRFATVNNFVYKVLQNDICTENGNLDQ